MHGSARVCSLLTRPKSGIAACLPQVASSSSPLFSDPHPFLLQASQWHHPGASPARYSSLVTQHCRFLIAGEKILKIKLTPSVPMPNAFLIAGVCPTFSHASLRAFLIGTRSRLEIKLTHSQQTRKYFLIGTICPTFLVVPHRAKHQDSRTTPFLFDTNGIRKTVALIKTKENQRSIRYKFAHRGTGNLACARWSWVGLLPSAPPITHRRSLITTHQSLITTASALDSVHSTLLSVGRTTIQERP